MQLASLPLRDASTCSKCERERRLASLEALPTPISPQHTQHEGKFCADKPPQPQSRWTSLRHSPLSCLSAVASSHPSRPGACRIPYAALQGHDLTDGGTCHVARCTVRGWTPCVHSPPIECGLRVPLGGPICWQPTAAGRGISRWSARVPQSVEPCFPSIVIETVTSHLPAAGLGRSHSWSWSWVEGRDWHGKSKRSPSLLDGMEWQLWGHGVGKWRMASHVLSTYHYGFEMADTLTVLYLGRASGRRLESGALHGHAASEINVVY
jgi:hypothetical protein